MGDVKADNPAKSEWWVKMWKNQGRPEGRAPSTRVRRVLGGLGGAAKTEMCQDLHFRPCA